MIRDSSLNRLKPMVHVTFVDPRGHRRTVQAPFGHSAMETAVRHGVPGIEGECGGNLVCATCHAHVAPEWQSKLKPPSRAEAELLDLTLGATDASRLCCQIRLSPEHDGLELLIPAHR